MESQVDVYITLVAMSGVLNLFLGIYAFAHRKDIPNARTFLIYVIALSFYIFGFAFELASDSLAEIKRWIVVEYMGMPFAAVFGLLLIFHYLGKRIPRFAVAAMFVIPVITLVMVATNDAHHLFYKSIYLRTSSPSPLVDISIGEWYIVHGAYTFACLLAGSVMLIRRWPQSKGTFRPQHVTLTFSQIIPMVSSFLYLMGVTPQGIDPVPIVLSITSCMYFWAIASSRMLTIVPIAKEIIFESMREGVIVLDSARRIVDYNPALAVMMPEAGNWMVGRKLPESWQKLTGTAFPVVETFDNMEEELEWTIEGRKLTSLVRTSQVLGKSGETLGTLVLLIDVTEQRRLQDQLRQLAYTDVLTGIANRAQFFHLGKLMLKEAAASRSFCSFLLFDLDFFKRINDTYGHDVGDQALVHVAKVCKRSLPPRAVFARYGGEEFVIGLPGASMKEAGEVAERLRMALSGEPLRIQSGLLQITASFGVAEYAGGSQTLEALLREADAALYEAKRNGRDAVILAAATTESAKIDS